MIEGHGDDAYKFNSIIKANFSTNTCYGVDYSSLINHLFVNINDRISSYPEPQPYALEATIANRHHLPNDAVCVTNGATEAIYLIAQTFSGSCSAIFQPTFSEYADACRIHGHRIKSLYALPSAHQDYRLSADVRMLWLCNPNNPTGMVVDAVYLQELIHHNDQVCFVIDQSYENFTLKPLLPIEQMAQYPNVLLLHSMTKEYAIPGLRLGYMTGMPGLLKRIRSNRMPWSVNQLAIEAGLFLTKNPPSHSFDIYAYLAETNRLKTALEAIGGIEVWDTDTHFMLVRLRMGKASALKAYLVKEHGILIRDAANFEGLDEHYFRIATQSPEENDALVKAITEWVYM